MKWSRIILKSMRDKIFNKNVDVFYSNEMTVIGFDVQTNLIGFGLNNFVKSACTNCCSFIFNAILAQLYIRLFPFWMRDFKELSTFWYFRLFLKKKKKVFAFCVKSLFNKCFKILSIWRFFFLLLSQNLREYKEIDIHYKFYPRLLYSNNKWLLNQTPLATMHINRLIYQPNIASLIWIL